MNRVTFHGAYQTKAKAVKKERRVKGFIKKTKVNGEIRYIVMRRKK